jgi:YD repeat-containing protein
VVKHYADATNPNGLSSTGQWTTAQVTQALTPGADDRTIVTEYDLAGRQSKVTQSSSFVYTTTVAGGGAGQTAAAETRYQYNVFGQLSRISVLLDPASGATADTSYYYDHDGRQHYIVDPRGFVTRKDYDGRGNVTLQIEYSRALSAGPLGDPALVQDTTSATSLNDPNGYDRRTELVYDTLDRVVEQRLYDLDYTTISAGVATAHRDTQYTYFAYDAVGNRTLVTDAMGNQTYTYYDVLGRVSAIAQAKRDVDVDGDGAINPATEHDVIPLTDLRRDVYGNLVEEIDYRQGATNVSVNGYTTPSATGARYLLVQNDVYGRAMRTQDAMSASQYFSYDRRGNIAKEWTPVTDVDGNSSTLVTIHQYDALGRETATIQPQRRAEATAGGVTAIIAQSARWYQVAGPASPQWTDENQLLFSWPEIPMGRIRVEVDYVKKLHDNVSPGLGGFVAQNFTNAVTGAFVHWYDQGIYDTDNGVHHITHWTVWSLDANGNKVTLLIDSANPPTGSAVSIRQTIYTQYQYNAFGEMTSKGVNAARAQTAADYQEYFQYDTAGRLWRTNSGDGIDKVYLYDTAGRITAEIRSENRILKTYVSDAAGANALGTADAMRSETAYDAAGNVRLQKSPTYTRRDVNGPLSGSPQATPTRSQTLDRWGHVLTSTDASGHTTNYLHNVLGNLIETQMPLVAVLDTRTSLVASNQRPVARNYYDLVGRGIGKMDANGNVSSVAVNGAGQTLSEHHADGGDKSYLYDTFGNQTQVTDELGWLTRNTYDDDNRLTAVSNEYKIVNGGGVYVTRNFGYDQAGRRTYETSGELMDDGVNAEKTRYYYDLLGNVIKRVSPKGVAAKYDYDVHNRKIDELNMGGDTMTWDVDAFGRVHNHVDMGGNAIHYDYNLDGTVKTETAINGINIAYAYDEGGNLITITDTGVSRTTDYAYDSAGRRTRERTINFGITMEDLTIGYDALDRVSTLSDVRYSLTYNYDAQGNRTRTLATYVDQKQVNNPLDLWYQYDAVNRVTLSQGAIINVNGVQQLGYNNAQGIKIQYDLRGQRSRTDQFGGDMLQRYDQQVWNGFFYDTTSFYQTTFGEYAETHNYDGMGRLTATYRTGQIISGTVGNPPSSTTPFGLTLVSTRDYDNASRVKWDYSAWLDTQTVESIYDDDGHLTSQAARTGTAHTGARTSLTTFTFNGEGILLGYQVTGFNITNGQESSQKYLSTYIQDYEKSDTYQAGSQGVSTTGNGTTSSGAISRFYNVNHELVSETDSHNSARNRFFANDANGHALMVVKGNYTTESARQLAFANALTLTDNAVKAQFFFFEEGRNVGSLGQLANENPDSIAFRANFDANYTPVADMAASTPTVIVTRDGDTLRKIAQSAYGDGSLWYLIGEANGLTQPDDVIESGRELQIPNTSYALANTDRTFKPFSVSSELAALSPTMVAPPPPRPQCAMWKVLVVVIIVIIVTILTRGALTKPTIDAAVATSTISTSSGAVIANTATVTYSIGGMNAIAAGVISAGVGATVGQFASMALGLQDRFDFKAVALAALSAGVGEALGAAAQASSAVETFASQSPYLFSALEAAAGSMITQGAAVLLHLQDKFNWGDVARATITAPIALAAGNFAGARTLGIKTSQYAKIAQSVGGDAALNASSVSTIVSAGVNAALGGRVNAIQVAGDVFGNIIGIKLVDAINAPSRSGTVSIEGEDSDTAGAQASLETSILEAHPAQQEPAAAIAAQRSADSAPAMVSTSTSSGAEVSGDEEQMDEIVVTGSRKQALEESAAYERAVGRLGRGKPFVLYDAAIGTILHNAEMNSATREATGGWFGADYQELGLSIDETEALAGYIRRSGVADSYQDISGGEALLLTTGQQAPDDVYHAVTDTLGRLVTNDDLQSLLPIEDLQSANREDMAVDLTPLEDTVVDRFYSDLARNPEVLKAAEAYRKAGNLVIGPDDLGWMTKTERQLALDTFNGTLSRVRSEMIDADLMPSRIVTKGRGEAIYQFIGTTMLAFAADQALGMIGIGFSALFTRGSPVVLDLFGGATTRLSGAINVDIVAKEGVKASALQLPFRNGVADRIIASNPYIPGGGGMMDYLPEAARVLKPNGEIVINSTARNPFGILPDARVLDSLGLKVIEANGPLLPEFQNGVYRLTDGRLIPNKSMRTTILRKAGK